MKSLHQTDRRQVLVYFSEASLPQYQWIKKENLIKFHTSLLQVRLQKPNPTQTKKPEVTVGCRVEYQDAATGMSKLGLVCALEGDTAHVADLSTLHRVIPWYVDFLLLLLLLSLYLYIYDNTLTILTRKTQVQKHTVQGIRGITRTTRVGAKTTRVSTHS